jgi:hypothetical protein
MCLAGWISTRIQWALDPHAPALRNGRLVDGEFNGLLAGGILKD